MNKNIGIIGLGKMGSGVATHLQELGWDVVVYNRSPEKMVPFKRIGCKTVTSPQELVESLKGPRLIWIMLPAGNATEEMLFGADGISKFLKKGDVVVDAANSYFEDAPRREKKLAKLGVSFVDVGYSGGPHGARHGGCLMTGGNKKVVTKLEPLFKSLSVPDGYLYCGASGAGHFTKMVHNGIEYGMMQALAEGFEVLKKSKYKLNLQAVASLYNHGSVIESSLVGWLESGYKAYGDDLKSISSTVAHTGEGQWTIQTAKKMKVPVKIIEESYKFRVASSKRPSYTGKVLSTLRNQFGGHAAK